MLYRDFPAWLKLLTVVLTLGAAWLVWRGVDAVVDGLPSRGVYLLGAVVLVAIVAMLIGGTLIERRKARRPNDVGTLQDYRDRP